MAHVWRDMAMLMQDGISILPESARFFAMAFGVVGAALPIVELHLDQVIWTVVWTIVMQHGTIKGGKDARGWER